MISAVILAGGASQRMGSPKALLKIGGRTFLEHIDDACTAARITDRVVVLGADAEKIRPALAGFTGTVVVNGKWESGQLSSILCGCDAVQGEGCHGIMVWPVDRPLVTAHLCVGLLQAFWTSGKPIIVPVFDGKRGHPVIFSKDIFDELRNAPAGVGARAVLQSDPSRICHVETQEEGILMNIDTPEEYRRTIPKS